jgi:hypothetical protein
MDDRDFVILSISTFEKTAFNVIGLMAEHFGLDLSSGQPFNKLLLRSNEFWNGRFLDWEYRFHGNSCQFVHVNTKQLLDIKVVPPGNYGAINYFYLFRFIQTTRDLKQLNSEISETQIYRILDHLKKDGSLINRGTEFFPQWVLSHATPE